MANREIVIRIPEDKYDRLTQQMRLDRNFNECEITELGEHENYTGEIKDYVSGIEQDLANVTANKGYGLVRATILEQTKRLADIAVHNAKYRKEWFEKVIGEIKELAKFHSVEVPVVYGDGEETVDKMVSLEELGRILAEIEAAIGEESW